MGEPWDNHDSMRQLVRNAIDHIDYWKIVSWCYLIDLHHSRLPFRPAMNPKTLLPILIALSQIPLPPQEKASDFVIWLNWCIKGFAVKDLEPHDLCFSIYIFIHGFPSVKVEVCSGEGHLSRALWSYGYCGKAFDESWLNGIVHIKTQRRPIYNHWFGCTFQVLYFIYTSLLAQL